MNYSDKILSPAVYIRNASLSFNGSLLFDDLNITLSAGKITCLLGPSGVGKTTLLHIIAGLTTQDFKGDIYADHGKLLQSQIAYLQQSDSLLPWLNALDNALLGHRLRGHVNTAQINRAETFFQETGMMGALKKYPHQLSGGMRQRVALIRTLLEDKPICLMDEPFSALDMITRFELQNFAVHLLKKKTVLWVTHDPLEALRMADHIYILTGSPATIQHTLDLTTPTPRAMDQTDVLHNQAVLFAALKAKAYL